MLMKLRTTPGQREALRRSATLLRNQAKGLEETGSKKTVAAIDGYINTLEKAAAAQDDIDIEPAEKVALQQVSFLLEGIRDSLLNADFRERAQVIQNDIDQLDDIIVRFNTKAALD
jgi:hypothetical protein